MPLDETQTSDFIDDLDVGTLESELESLENSFNALQGDIQETLQEPAEPPPVQTEQGDELDELFGLDAGLDLSTPEVEQAQESASEAEDDVLAALEQELMMTFFLQGDDEDKTNRIGPSLTIWATLKVHEILDKRCVMVPRTSELAKELMTAWVTHENHVIRCGSRNDCRSCFQDSPGVEYNGSVYYGFRRRIMSCRRCRR